MRDRQIADPQAEWTTELGHTEEKRERERRGRDVLCLCICVMSSVTLNEAIIELTVLSLAEVDQRLACWGIWLASALGQFIG